MGCTRKLKKRKIQLNFSGLPLVFQKFFQVFQISSGFLKVRFFESIFSFKLNLKSETVLHTIKTLKRYSKITLKVILKKNF